MNIDTLGIPWNRFNCVAFGLKIESQIKERRRLARGAGSGQDRTGEDPAERGREDHTEDGSPAAYAERVGGLAQAARDEQQDLLARARPSAAASRSRARPRRRTQYSRCRGITIGPSTRTARR